jgi:hypothetical protein
MGNLKSIDDGRKLVRDSFKIETILPHANAWKTAYEKLERFL